MTFELFMMLVMASCMVIACVLFLAFPSAPQDKQEDLPQPESTPMRITVLSSKFKENRDLLFIEYIQADLHKLVVGFKASVAVQAQLLVAADVLLDNLPRHIRNCLGRPILSDQIEWLLQGGDPEKMTPERVRAALAVAEASQALHTMMFDFGCSVDKFSYQIAVDEKTGAFVAGNKSFISPYIPKRIMVITGVNLAMASEIWWRIIKIMRDGSVKIPGAKAVKEENYYAEINISA